MDLGFVLLIVLVLGLPIWLSRGLRNRLKERLAPVPAQSTTVVLDQTVQPDPPPLPRPSMLSHVVIRTHHGGNTHRFTRDGASGMGYDPHEQDAQDAHAHGGHGDGL